LVLTGLLTVQPVTVDQDGVNQWNIYEQCPINVKSIVDNFNLNPDLWAKNESKLAELFVPVD
jgi:hypothetical protein